MAPAHGIPDVVSIESLEALSAVLALKEESLPHGNIDEAVLQMVGLAYKDDCREDLEHLEDRVSSSFLGYSTSCKAFLNFRLSTAHFPRAGVVEEGEGKVLEGLLTTTRFLAGSAAEGCVALRWAEAREIDRWLISLWKERFGGGIGICSRRGSRERRR
ncbi:hypothetical protein ACLOJK_027928 [Asimina triloba]